MELQADDRRPSFVDPIGVAPSVTPEFTRTGRFRDRRTERDFVHHRFERELKRPLRWSAWSATAIYVLFGIVDYLVVWDATDTAWLLRYGVVCPIAVVLAILTVTSYAERCVRWVGIIHSLIGPFLFLTVGAVASDPGGMLYATWGVTLFPILVPQLTRLGVLESLGVTIAILAYLIGAETMLAHRSLWIDVFLGILLVLGCGYGLWVTYAAEVAGRRSFWQEKVIAWQMDEIAREREKSERLLLNVLPESIASRLRGGERTIADAFENVTVLFADIVGFTGYSARVPAQDLVMRLDTIFSRFDDIADRLGLEKIKTIGDAYMVAGGLPEPRADAAVAVCRMALEMKRDIETFNELTGEQFHLRMGIHTGPVVAGVIGRRKFIYDLWGDTVNVASRMESHGEPDKIQITEATFAALEGSFGVEPRGEVVVKGKGSMKTYWLLRARDASSP